MNGNRLMWIKICNIKKKKILKKYYPFSRLKFVVCGYNLIKIKSFG